MREEVILDDMVDALSTLSKTAIKIKKSFDVMASICVNISKSPHLKALYCNNYRKMHGLPMRRKVKR